MHVDKFVANMYNIVHTAFSFAVAWMHHLSTLDHTGAICQTNLIDLSSPSAMYEDKELTKGLTICHTGQIV